MSRPACGICANPRTNYPNTVTAPRVPLYQRGLGLGLGDDSIDPGTFFDSSGGLDTVDSGGGLAPIDIGTPTDLGPYTPQPGIGPVEGPIAVGQPGSMVPDTAIAGSLASTIANIFGVRPSTVPGSGIIAYSPSPVVPNQSYYGPSFFSQYGSYLIPAACVAAVVIALTFGKR